jgi:hypothetical protein
MERIFVVTVDTSGNVRAADVTGKVALPPAVRDELSIRPNHIFDSGSDIDNAVTALKEAMGSDRYGQ